VPTAKGTPIKLASASREFFMLLECQIIHWKYNLFPLQYWYSFSESYDALTITYAGHGLINEATALKSDAYADTARYEEGKTKANAACQTDYNANPLYANTITSELFCFDGKDAAAEKAQACEVRFGL